MSGEKRDSSPLLRCGNSLTQQTPTPPLLPAFWPLPVRRTRTRIRCSRSVSVAVLARNSPKTRWFRTRRKSPSQGQN